MKVCLFGGTFDPPHLGHLIIAQTIFEAENFDQIVFVPAYQPPHKNGIKISPVDQRLEMLNIAIKENPNFIISDLEIERKGLSYSIDTIMEYKKQNNLKSNELFYLMGSDSLKQFNIKENFEEEKIKQKIKNNEDIYGRGFKLKKINIDDSFPEYIIKNQKLLKEWII